MNYVQTTYAVGDRPQIGGLGNILQRKRRVWRKLSVIYKALLVIVLEYAATDPTFDIKIVNDKEAGALRRRDEGGLDDASISESHILYASCREHGLPKIMETLQSSPSLQASPRTAFNAILGFARLCFIMSRAKSVFEWDGEMINPLWFRRRGTPEVDEALLKASIRLWEHEGQMTDLRSAQAILQMSQHFQDGRFNGDHYFCLRTLRFMQLGPRYAIATLSTKWMTNELPPELAMMVLDCYEEDSGTSFRQIQELLGDLKRPLQLPSLEDCGDPRCLRDLTTRTLNCPNKAWYLALPSTNDYIILHPSTMIRDARGNNRWKGFSVCPLKPCPGHHS